MKSPLAGRKPNIIFNMSLPRRHVISSKTSPISGPTLSGAALSLSSVLLRAGQDRLHFMPAALLNDGALPAGVDRRERSIFALTLYDRFFMETEAEVRLIRELYPHSIIMLGGPAISTAADLKKLASFFPQANVLVKGDGEKIIVPLVSAFSQEKVDWPALEQLSGVYIRYGQKEYCNNALNQLSEAELNALPGLPELAELKEEITKNGRLYLHTSRGCRYRCVFCSHKVHSQPIYWTAERLIQELLRVKGRIEKGELPAEAINLTLTDDDFFQDRGRALAFFRLLQNEPELENFFILTLQGSVSSFFHQGRLDRELLELIEEQKPLSLYLGSDGFHPAALAYLRKNHSFQQMTELIAALDQLGIPQFHYVILTYPTITRQVLQETAQTLSALLNRYSTMKLGINIGLIAYGGTPLQQVALTQGLDPFISSPTGERHPLPVNLKLADQELDLLLKHFFQQPLPSPAEAAEMDRQDRGEFWLRYGYELLQLGIKRPTSVWELLIETNNVFCQSYVLRLLSDSLIALEK